MESQAMDQGAAGGTKSTPKTQGANAQAAKGHAAKAIVICGLGRLGQNCVELLRAFGAPVIGVDKVAPPPDEDFSGLDRIVIGDCASSDVLKKANVDRCRAILILTADPRTNVAAAFAARRLNPNVRIVIRSAQAQLNRLLAEHLGDFVAFEPDRFAAPAFAVAALADETKAQFDLKGTKARVVTHRVQPGDWCDGVAPLDLQSLHLRVIGHVSGQHCPIDLFAMESANVKIKPGDEITFASAGDLFTSARSAHPRPKKRRPARWTGLIGRARGRMSGASMAAFGSLAMTLGMTFGAIWLYHAENSDISWFDAVNVAVVLAVGGFDNVFGSLKAPFAISAGLYAYSLLMKIGSAVFLGIVFATITEKILGARFAIVARRPEPPAEQHTILVGLSPIGQNIAELLKQWGRAAVGVAEDPVAENLLPGLPIETGPIHDALARANIATARSVVITGDDQIANLETMLLVRSMNPHCDLVFRVADRELAANIAALIPESVGISDWDVVAQAIAGAAFGETILDAFRLPGRSVLVTEYRIETGDTLINRNLAQIAYGYGAVPVLHARGDASQFIPSDDILLEAGDQLVVLATVEALGRIERGEVRPPIRRLLIESRAQTASAFEAGNIIARIAGCDLALARRALQSLPCELACSVYRPQGLRLVRELGKNGFGARLIELESGPHAGSKDSDQSDPTNHD